jgi:GT2 family glycosyltransferase
VSDRLCDVVIATRNRPAALRRCLHALAHQSVRDFGVIVVDDASDEPVVVEDPALSSLDVRVIRQPRPSGPAAARNAGAAVAVADYIVFIDDDVVADRRLIEVHSEAVRAPHDPAHPIVSFGPFVQPSDWTPTPWNLWEARQAKKEADAMLRGEYEPTWRQFHTGNNCVPTAAFRRAGGFDESFTRAEDDEFALRLERLGCVFRFEPAAIAWHYSNRSLEAWVSIPRAYAHFDVEIDRMHQPSGYLEAKKRELTERRLPLRIARRVFGGPRRTKVATTGALAASRALYCVGLVDLSMAALSLAYDLNYVDAMRDAETAATAAKTSGATAEATTTC